MSDCDSKEIFIGPLVQVVLVEGDLFEYEGECFFRGLFALVSIEKSEALLRLCSESGRPLFAIFSD